ncbi:hypothetical protein F4553_004721 [Allocatelliglobosispora scoriae]|uniref:Uncharacterized protein n=1 Tax=Allocatelliglobosispora scoriae TaxID=643052 RepID=A0A841BX49_9ACTN|nr:hypothetical protein [Allocatelliglobosispora scoriae]MBB5871342.1 hypothetical protein [Allocatelliglobosispora scoriae]
MTTEPELGQPEETAKSPGISRAARAVTVAVALGLVAWFFFAWLVLDRHLLDAAGESVGTALLLLIVVSVVGAVWRNNARDR